MCLFCSLNGFVLSHLGISSCQCIKALSLIGQFCEQSASSSLVFSFGDSVYCKEEISSKGMIFLRSSSISCSVVLRKMFGKRNVVHLNTCHLKPNPVFQEIGNILKFQRLSFYHARSEVCTAFIPMGTCACQVEMSAYWFFVNSAF